MNGRVCVRSYGVIYPIPKSADLIFVIFHYLYFSFFFFFSKTTTGSIYLQSVMSEVKDPAIKLFGKTIQIPDIPVTAPEEASECGEDAPTQSTDTSVGDASIQHIPSSPNSLPEDTSFNRSEAEQDVDKVRLWVVILHFLNKSLENGSSEKLWFDLNFETASCRG